MLTSIDSAPSKPWLRASPDSNIPLNTGSEDLYRKPINQPQLVYNSEPSFGGSLSSTIASISNFVQIVDSTVYSLWSSVSNLLALISQFSSFHQQYFTGATGNLRRVLDGIVNVLFAYPSLSRSNLKRIATVLAGLFIALGFTMRKYINDHLLTYSGSCHDNVVASCLYSFMPRGPNQLTLTPGVPIKISREDVDKVGKLLWIKGWNNNGECGLIPANYVQIL